MAVIVNTLPITICKSEEALSKSICSYFVNLPFSGSHDVGSATIAWPTLITESTTPDNIVPTF